MPMNNDANNNGAETNEANCFAIVARTAIAAAFYEIMCTMSLGVGSTALETCGAKGYSPYYRPEEGMNMMNIGALAGGLSLGLCALCTGIQLLLAGQKATWKTDLLYALTTFTPAVAMSGALLNHKSKGFTVGNDIVVGLAGLLTMGSITIAAALVVAVCCPEVICKALCCNATRDENGPNETTALATAV